MTIGEQIQNLRIQKGLTQERLAEMVEVKLCLKKGYSVFFQLLW